MYQLGLIITEATHALLNNLSDAGRTAILVSVDGSLTAVIGLADTVKPGVCVCVCACVCVCVCVCA
jgi:cation transport ATPase